MKTFGFGLAFLFAFPIYAHNIIYYDFVNCRRIVEDKTPINLADFKTSSNKSAEQKRHEAAQLQYVQQYLGLVATAWAGYLPLSEINHTKMIWDIADKHTRAQFAQALTDVVNPIVQTVFSTARGEHAELTRVAITMGIAPPEIFKFEMIDFYKDKYSKPGTSRYVPSDSLMTLFFDGPGLWQWTLEEGIRQVLHQFDPA